MKKISMFLAACTLVAGLAFTLTSCEKHNPDDDSGLIDDNGNGNGNETPGNNGDSSLHASLQGSNYYLIQLDGTTYEKISSKVVADLRPDDQAKFLYVWESTYTGGETSGKNFYGVVEGWICLRVTSVGWSGAGWYINNKDGLAPQWAKMKDLANGTSSYYLHVGYKGAAGVAHILGFGYGDEYKFAVGDGSLEDAGKNYNAIAPISNGGKFVAGEWNEYEIKLSDMGIDFSKDIADGNVFWCLSGGVTGTQIDLDAVFVYKK
ncbi:MAG: hypothetical protein IKZ91_04490 [Bacteroidales bacterium]|nr:hypothetical protein [Bacteroidales bacterium]